jgi:tRNA1(Val) A37 N6-methylase TrmN6
MKDSTAGTLLGGRVSYRQFAAGHRSGFEPVFLAAAVPAQAGERVLEAGTGFALPGGAGGGARHRAGA